MTAKCAVCGEEATGANAIMNGICTTCSFQISNSSNKRELLEAIAAPVLLMQGNPRQVITANKQALGLFGKELHEVEDKRGGQVFDCVHSFTEAGCGKDANCENCKIKNAIVDTFNTGNSHTGVSTSLQIRKANGTSTYVVQVSTEKVGDLALVKVERYDEVHPQRQ